MVPRPGDTAPDAAPAFEADEAPTGGASLAVKANVVPSGDG